MVIVICITRPETARLRAWVRFAVRVDRRVLQVPSMKILTMPMSRQVC
jgi:hypothetical protein